MAHAEAARLVGGQAQRVARQLQVAGEGVERVVGWLAFDLRPQIAERRLRVELPPVTHMLRLDTILSRGMEAPCGSVLPTSSLSLLRQELQRSSRGRLHPRLFQPAINVSPLRKLAGATHVSCSAFFSLRLVSPSRFMVSM